jgi:multidrug efflux pump subunit AcrA (membrane-fusion protein)
MNELDVALGDFKTAVDGLAPDQSTLDTAQKNLATAQKNLADAQSKITTDMAGLQAKLDAVNIAAKAMGLIINA